MVSCEEYVAIRKKQLKKMISEFDRKPTLCIVQVDCESENNIYEEVGVNCICIKVDSSIYDRDSFIDLIDNLNWRRDIDGIAIQLPVGKFDAEVIHRYVSPAKDVCGFRRDSWFPSCEPEGIISWLDYNDFEFSYRNALLIGCEKFSGKQMSHALIDMNMTVAWHNGKSHNMDELIGLSDLIISSTDMSKDWNDGKIIINTRTSKNLTILSIIENVIEARRRKMA